MNCIAKGRFFLAVTHGAVVFFASFGLNMLFPTFRVVLAFRPQRIRSHGMQLAKGWPRRHTVAWMSTEVGEKSEEEKAAIKAAREARK